MTDEQTTPVQGDQPQGGIFDPYLQAVPESWDQPPSGSPRDVVSKYLSDAEKGVNSRLQEAADIQKRFGPYSEVDFSGYDKDQLSNLLGWHQQMSTDDDAFREWLKDAATEAGLLGQEEEPEPEALTPDSIKQLITEAIQGQIAPLQEQNAQRAEVEQKAQLEQSIVSAFSQIEKDHGKLSDEQKEAIGDLGESHQGDDWIEVGFKRFQALTGQAQADLVKDKTNQPTPPVKAGGQEAPQRSTSWKDAAASAEERLRQQLQT